MVKVAVCLSGQLRTWKKCIDTWNKINGPYSVDFFCHTWNVNTVPNYFYHQSAEFRQLQQISQDELDEFKDRLNPKQLIVEPYRIIQPAKRDQAILDANYLSQYYGIMMAGHLKHEYEVENNIIYDVVVRSRYDLFFGNDISTTFTKLKENTFHGFHFSWNKNHQGRIGDMFWFSDSYTYDIISSFYLGIENISRDRFVDEDLPPEHAFFYYLKKNNIKLEVDNPWDVKIFRSAESHVTNKGKNSHEIW